MKKTLLLAGLLLAIAPSVQAQITLTAATHMPQPSINVYQRFTGSTSMPLPDTGANVTWNYANLTPDSARHIDYFNCVPQADCAGYGNANLVQGVIADSAFNYYRNAGNICQLTGAGSPLATTTYTDVVDYYRFPITYNTRYSDTYAATLSVPSFGLTITNNGTFATSGAGYGTLTTPLGTYPNVLMVRIINNIVTTNMGVSKNDLGHIYMWFDANTRNPILAMNFNFSDNGSGQFVVDGVSGDYMDASASAVSTVSATENFHLAPNPSTGNTRLEIPASFGTNATVLITDISGKKVFSQTAEKNAIIDINTTNWAKGIYLVRVQSATGEALMQKLSVQ